MILNAKDASEARAAARLKETYKRAEQQPAPQGLSALEDLARASIAADHAAGALVFDLVIQERVRKIVAELDSMIEDLV